MKLVVALIALLIALPANAAARFAVVVGNNVGATGRAKLWFAERDADRFARALRELGDFSEDRILIVRGGHAGDVKDAIAKVEERIVTARNAGERSLLVVYFSGHAGSNGLELGDDKIGYEDLRKLVSGSAADAKIAIVDACEAGALTQVKGMVAAPALDFALPEDQVRGTAFLASTAVGEAAQESAAIGGSFFTHNLEVALRGAGDADGDGQVTLSEAFRYTASRTVSNTASTESGPQHPTYEFRMSGRGDVILADLRRGDASLRLPADERSTYILKGPRDLLAEVPGPSAPLKLALPSGHYVIERRSEQGRATAELNLNRGDAIDLPPLRPTRYDIARAKGGPAPTLGFGGGGVFNVPLSGAGFAPLLRAGARQEFGAWSARFHVDAGRRDVLITGGKYSISRVAGGLGLVTPLAYGKVMLEAGAEAGYGYSWQGLPDNKSASAGDFSLSGLALVSTRVGPSRLGLDLALGAQTLKIDGKMEVKPAVSAGLVFLFGVGQ
ncbi:MAG: caspase domain-containing protein [Myxococcales bacterium]